MRGNRIGLVALSFGLFAIYVGVSSAQAAPAYQPNGDTTASARIAAQQRASLHEQHSSGILEMFSFSAHGANLADATEAASGALLSVPHAHVWTLGEMVMVQGPSLTEKNIRDVGESMSAVDGATMDGAIKAEPLESARYTEYTFAPEGRFLASTGVAVQARAGSLPRSGVESFGDKIAKALVARGSQGVAVFYFGGDEHATLSVFSLGTPGGDAVTAYLAGAVASVTGENPSTISETDIALVR